MTGYRNRRMIRVVGRARMGRTRYGTGTKLEVIMARQAQITVERDEDTLVIEFAHGKRIEVRPAELVA